MSTTTMPGKAVTSMTPGWGLRSHCSDTSEAEVTRTVAKAKAYFTRAAHKRDRADGRDALRTELATWLASRPADIFDEVADLVADYWAEASAADLYAGMSPEQIFAAIEEEQKAQDAFLFGLEPDPEEYLDDLHEGLDEEHVSPGSLAWELAQLSHASVMTMEEAFAEGLRVTVKPSGYTYGRS